MNFYKQLPRIVLFFTAAILFFCHCTQKNGTFNQIDWIVGNWSTDQDSNLVTYENWARLDDSTYAGTAYTISDSDTTFSETLYIRFKEGEIYYVASIPTHDEGKPVSFVLRPGKNDQMQFYNPNHDFPQRIVYTRVSDTIINARVEGKVKGELMQQKFKMYKRN